MLSELHDVTISRSQIIEKAETDLDFFAALILGEVYQYPFSTYHKAIWQLLITAAKKETGKEKYALGVPRGFAKTILGKLFITWLILYSDHRFILIVCNTSRLAEEFLSDVVDMLDCENVKMVYGNWRNSLEKDRQDIKKFSFKGYNRIIAALGSGSSLRGLNVKYERPSFILMDDMQNREEAENQETAKQLLVWMIGTLMKAASPKRCIYVFIGNMYPFEGSILKKLKEDSQWISLITGAILADGTSLWPEHRSVEDLMAELASDTALGCPEVFYAEVMNDAEAGTVSGVDTHAIPLLPDDLNQFHAQAGFIIIDPSLGKKTSDDVAIGAFLVFDAKIVLWDLMVGKFNSEEIIKESLTLASRYNIPLIAVESAGFQESLCFWFDRFFESLNITGIKVVTVSTGGLQKVARIKEFFKNLLSGSILLHPKVRNPVIYQISQFNPLKPAKNKDDILDVCAHATRVWNENMHQCILPIHADISVLETSASHTADLALSF